MNRTPTMNTSSTSPIPKHNNENQNDALPKSAWNALNPKNVKYIITAMNARINGNVRFSGVGWPDSVTCIYPNRYPPKFVDVLQCMV